jgi:hypothetical protein
MRFIEVPASKVFKRPFLKTGRRQYRQSQSIALFYREHWKNFYSLPTTPAIRSSLTCV